MGGCKQPPYGDWFQEQEARHSCLAGKGQAGIPVLLVAGFPTLVAPIFRVVFEKKAGRGLFSLDNLLAVQYVMASIKIRPWEDTAMEAIPTDRELEALKVLWRDGEATVRDVYDRLCESGARPAYTTVLSLLQVMEQKGLVKHRQEGKAYLYSAAVDRGCTFRTLAGGFLERVFDGAMDEYLVHALQSRRPSGDELDRLEQMIGEARERQAKRQSRKGRGS
jgi:BlaI family transcriptional regulator, penicillinase repressor